MIPKKKKQLSSVWVFENDSAPKKFIREKAETKKWSPLFFGIIDVSSVAPEDRHIVN